jgi:hypothetical protein
MTRDDIIRLAKEAGMAEPTEFLYNNYWTAGQSELERFAEFVAKAERGACLKLATEPGRNKAGVAAAIRARGQ